MNSAYRTAFFLSSLIIAVQLAVVAILFFCGVEEIERLIIAAIFIGVAARLTMAERRDDQDEGLERAVGAVLTLALVYGVAQGQAFSSREFLIAAVLAAGAIILADILNPKMKAESKGSLFSSPLIMAVPQLSIIAVATILVTR